MGTTLRGSGRHQGKLGETGSFALPAIQAAATKGGRRHDRRPRCRHNTHTTTTTHNHPPQNGPLKDETPVRPDAADDVGQKDEGVPAPGDGAMASESDATTSTSQVAAAPAAPLMELYVPNPDNRPIGIGGRPPHWEQGGWMRPVAQPPRRQRGARGVRRSAARVRRRG